MSHDRNNTIESPELSKHAHRRMAQRGISPVHLHGALVYGRKLHLRGARVYVVGRREVERAARRGLNLRDLDGIHVVCSNDGLILTVYRNRRQLSLRDRKRRPADARGQGRKRAA